MESLSLTIRGWKPQTYTMTSFEEEKAMVRTWLFFSYREIGDRITKVGITYEVVNYSSPAHTRETSEILTSRVYPINNHKVGEGHILFLNLTKWIVMANVIGLSTNGV